MSQFVLPETAGDTLRATLADIEAALRYLTESDIARQHVERWRDELRAALDQKVIAPVRIKPGRKVANASK